MTNRCVTLYSVNDLNKTLASLDFDTAPAILIPHYDEDSSTLFLTGRVSITLTRLIHAYILLLPYLYLQCPYP